MCRHDTKRRQLSVLFAPRANHWFKTITLIANHVSYNKIIYFCFVTAVTRSKKSISDQKESWKNRYTETVIKTTQTPRSPKF